MVTNRSYRQINNAQILTTNYKEMSYLQHISSLNYEHGYLYHLHIIHILCCISSIKLPKYLCIMLIIVKNGFIFAKKG